MGPELLHGELRMECNIISSVYSSPGLDAIIDDITHLGRPILVLRLRFLLAPPSRQAGTFCTTFSVCFPFLLSVCSLSSLEPQLPEFTSVFTHTEALLSF